MGKVVGHRWIVFWGNPYTDPPDGLERVQLQVYTRKTGHRPPEILEKLREMRQTAAGWALGCNADVEQGRTLSLNQKRKARRTKLYNKLKKDSPLLADQFYEEKLRSKPEYYGVTGMVKLPYPKG